MGGKRNDADVVRGKGRDGARRSIGISAIATGTVADAAEVKVLTSVALTSALDERAPQFERATGNKLKIGYSLIADIRTRILEGESADVIILSRPVLDELQKQDKIAAGTITNIAGTAVSVAARAGAPKPDMSSVDAFKRSLLAANRSSMLSR